jgi:hypothetical protein
MCLVLTCVKHNVVNTNKNYYYIIIIIIIVNYARTHRHITVNFPVGEIQRKQTGAQWAEIPKTWSRRLFDDYSRYE